MGGPERGRAQGSQGPHQPQPARPHERGRADFYGLGRTLHPPDCRAPQRHRHGRKQNRRPSRWPHRPPGPHAAREPNRPVRSDGRQLPATGCAQSTQSTQGSKSAESHPASPSQQGAQKTVAPMPTATATPEPEAVPLSALQHWRYCPRQCGLIHLEQVFDDNLATLRGQAVHTKADLPGVDTAKGVRVERALPLWHDALALTLINRGQLKAHDFVLREGGAVALQPDARKAVVVAYQERKKDDINHPLLAQSVPLGLVPLVQARLLARAMRDDGAPYV